MSTEMTWQGEKGRPLQLQRPCKCGCDQRGGYSGVGYLTGSSPNGNGFTLWIETEDVFERMVLVLQTATEAPPAPAPAVPEVSVCEGQEINPTQHQEAEIVTVLPKLPRHEELRARDRRRWAGPNKVRKGKRR